MQDPQEQAGFRHGISTVDQVVALLLQDINDSFQVNKKAGAVFLNLTAVYNTIWNRDLHLKLLRTIPDKHVKLQYVDIIYQSFILKTSNNQRNRLRILKNGAPRDQSFLQCSLTSIFTTFLKQLQASTAMRMI